MTKLHFFSSLFVAGALFAGGCERSEGEARIAVQGPGRVTSNPEGISCASDSPKEACEAELGRSFVLTAVPGENAHFDHWEGDELCVAARQATVAISKAPEHKLECTAVFADGAPSRNGGGAL